MTGRERREEEGGRREECGECSRERRHQLERLTMADDQTSGKPEIWKTNEARERSQ